MRADSVGARTTSPGSSMDESGILYIALGDPYIAMAINSAFSLRSVGIDWPISIVASRPESSLSNRLRSAIGPLVWQYISTDSEKSRLVKTSAIHYSPFNKTLLLDCDTIVRADFRKSFEPLAHFDVAAKLNAYGQQNLQKSRLDIPYLGLVANLPHWNTGVVFFSKSWKSFAFFRYWHTAFLDLGVNWDQASFARAVFFSPARFTSLDNRWNSQGGMPAKTAFIHHYTSAISLPISKNIRSCAKQVEGISHKRVASWITNRRAHRRRKIGLRRFLLEAVLGSTRSALLRTAP